MKCRPLGRSGLMVTELCLGTMVFGDEARGTAACGHTTAALGPLASTVVESVEKFQSLHPETLGMRLERYLPRRDEEETPDEEERPKEEIMDMEDLPEKGEEGSPADILKPKEEGIPYYDEDKKEWVLMPADLVKKVKEEVATDIEPVFEDAALKKKKLFKKTIKRAKDKEGAKPVETGEPYLWLQEEVHSKITFFVEGTGQEKNILCAEFIKEGLEAGEDIIVILGYPPKIFLSQMQKIGAVDLASAVRPGVG